MQEQIEKKQVPTISKKLIEFCQRHNLPHPLVMLLLLAVVGVAFVVRFLTSIIPIDTLVGVCLADDAFYYLKIAENIITGNGPTFDGQIQTNGFHPLFMLVCMILKIFYPGEQVVRALMIFLAMVGTLNTFLIYYLGKKIGGEVTGIAAAAFWALNPFVQFIELMGVEAPLAITAMVLTTIWWLRIRRAEKQRFWEWIILGILVGLCLLSRTDTIFFAVILAIEILVFFRKNLFGSAAKIITSAMVAFAVVSPWIIWNLHKFGRLAQDSGRSLMQLASESAAHYTSSTIDLLKNQAFMAIFDNFLRLFGYESYATALSALVIALVIGILLLIFFKDNHVGLFKGATSLIAAGFALWFFYNFIFMTTKYWYFLPLMAVFALCFGRMAGLLADRFGQARWLIFLCLFIIASFQWMDRAMGISLGGFHVWQKTYYQVAEDIRLGRVPEIETGEILGAWNAGIYGNYSGHRVINLDGVVNPNIYHAVQKRQFLRYVKSENIGYIIDHELMFNIYSPFSTMEFKEYFKLIKRYPVGTFMGDILILEVAKVPYSEQLKQKEELEKAKQQQQEEEPVEDGQQPTGE